MTAARLLHHRPLQTALLKAVLLSRIAQGDVFLSRSSGPPTTPDTPSSPTGPNTPSFSSISSVSSLPSLPSLPSDMTDTAVPCVSTLSTLSTLVCTTPIPTTPLHGAHPPSFFAASVAAAVCPVSTDFDLWISTPLHSFLDELLSASLMDNLSPALALTALVYMDRLHASAPTYMPTSANIHALFATAYLLATKFHEDDGPNCGAFASACHIRADTLARLERQFLATVGYRLAVSDGDLRDAEVSLMADALCGPYCDVVRDALHKEKMEGNALAHLTVSNWRVVTQQLVSGDKTRADGMPVRTLALALPIAAEVMAAVGVLLGVCDRSHDRRVEQEELEWKRRMSCFGACGLPVYGVGDVGPVGTPHLTDDQPPVEGVALALYDNAGIWRWQ